LIDQLTPSPVAVKLVIDVATNINVLNTSHIGVISVNEGFRVRIKKNWLQIDGKTDDCGERQTTNGLLKFLSEQYFWRPIHEVSSVSATEEE